MRHTLALVFGTCLIAVSALTWVGAQQPKPTATPSPADIEKALQTFRGDLQADRADLMAKNVTLTAAQAAKFWPLFESYQKEQDLIMDEQMKGIQRYVDMSRNGSPSACAWSGAGRARQTRSITGDAAPLDAARKRGRRHRHFRADGDGRAPGSAGQTDRRPRV